MNIDKSTFNYNEIIIDKDYDKLKFSRSIAVVFPNDYKVATSNLGFHAIIKNLSKFGFKPIRFFYDTKTKNFYTFDIDKKLNQFDNIFVSISFENDYDNLIFGLKNSFKKFPNFSNRIVIGGSAVTLSPFLFTDISSELAIGDCEIYFKNLISINELRFIDSKKIKNFFSDTYTDIENIKLENGLIKNILNIDFKKKLNNLLSHFNIKYNLFYQNKEPVYSLFILKLLLILPSHKFNSCFIEDNLYKSIVFPFSSINSNPTIPKCNL